MVEHKESSDLIQKNEVTRNYRSKKSKKASKENLRQRLNSDEEENMSNKEVKVDMGQKLSASIVKEVNSVSPSTLDQRVLNGSSRRDSFNMLSLSRMGETDIEDPVFVQNRGTRVSENDDIAELENSLLFDPHTDRIESNKLLNLERRMVQQQTQVTEVKSSTPSNKGNNIFSKFWQTLFAYISSPFTPKNNQSDNIDK